MKRLDHYYPTLGASWALAGLLLASSLIFGAGLGVLQRLLPSPLWGTVTLSYIGTMVLPLLFIWLMATRGRDAAGTGGAAAVPVNRPSFGSLKGFSVFGLAALAMLALTVVIDPLTSLLPMPESIKAVFERLFLGTHPVDSVIATCILAPLFEELLCRGMIQRGIAQSHSPRSAILWSAFLFALIHLNPWQAIPAFLLGLLFGWLYYRTGCLWLTIFLHCLNNSLSVVLSRLFPEMAVDSGFIDILPKETYLALCVGAALLLAGILHFFNRNLPKPSAL